MPHTNSHIYIVDDDVAVRDSLILLLETHEYGVSTFKDGEAFLAADPENMSGIVLLDIRMPGRDGIEILDEALKVNPDLVVIMMSGHADISIAVRTLKKGAFDFIEKPFHMDDVTALLEKAAPKLHALKVASAKRSSSIGKLEKLTPRERQIMDGLVEGKPNKLIASDLGISVRTVETHRARVMSKLDAKSVSDIVKISMALDHDGVNET